jgi:hypothetical protein
MVVSLSVVAQYYEALCAHGRDRCILSSEILCVHLIYMVCFDGCSKWEEHVAHHAVLPWPSSCYLIVNGCSNWKTAATS